MFAFDFDGTLVDSYSCLPEIYRSIAEEIGIEPLRDFIRRALEYEDLQESLGNYDRKTWWSKLFAEFCVELESVDLLLRKFWEMRAEKTVFNGSRNVLEALRSRSSGMVIIAGNDGQKSVKRMRIEKSGVAEYFDDIFIIGENVESRVEALELVAERYGVKLRDIVFVDDKPSPINEVKEAMNDVVAVRMKFSGILKLAWKGDCKADFEVESLEEILEVCRNLESPEARKDA